MTSPTALVITDQERSIMQALADGYTQRALAESLGVVPATVQTSVANLRERFQANTTYALLAKMMRGGYLQ